MINKCIMCRKEFYTKFRKGKHCSAKCRNAYHIEIKKAMNYICDECGKPWDSEYHVSDVCVEGREDFHEELKGGQNGN